jgi:alpha-mannosidase
MQRRDVLKGFSAAMGGTLLPRTAWTRAFQQEAKPLAVAIRGLVRREGKLLQPIRIALPDAQAASQVVTKVDGVAVDHRTLSEGVQSFDVLVEPVTTSRTSRVLVTVNGADQTANVQRKPVRKMVVYVLPHSHHDLGYTDLQADVEEKQINNILQGMQLAQKTEHYPAGARFVWNLEVLWGADLFLKRRPESDRTALREAGLG